MSELNHSEHNLQAEERIHADVTKYGWHVALFEATESEPSFAYSIGFWKTFGHPEIILFGLPLESLYNLINIAGEKIKQGDKLHILRDDFDFLEKFPVQFLDVDKEYFKEYLGYGIWFNEYKEFPALQLVWPDRNGNYPWQEGFEAKLTGKQPLLNKVINLKK